MFRLINTNINTGALTDCIIYHNNTSNVTTYATTIDVIPGMSICVSGPNAPGISGISGTAVSNVSLAYDTSTLYISNLGKRDLLKQRLKQQLSSPHTIHDDLIASSKQESEIRARALLREMIGESEFKRYVRRGFIIAKGKSGLIYKITGVNIICYFKSKDGKFRAIESLCVVFKNMHLPYADAVIMRKLLVENDEFYLRNVANIAARTLESRAA
jgi:hypothetical protein